MLCSKLCLASVSLSLASPVALAQCGQAESDTDSAQLNGYTRLLGALTSGKAVTVAVDFSQCIVVGTGTSGPPVVGGLLINDYLVPNNQYIAFSDVHETLDPHNARVTEFIRYQVMPDGKVSIRTTSVQLTDGTLSNQAEYQCAIGKGIHFTVRYRVRQFGRY